MSKVKKGLEFSKSRVVCNVQGQSDVDAGRIMGSATVARLNADSSVFADLQNAKAEVKNLRE